MKESIADIKIPEDLTCPITMLLLADPVMAADGYTYERSAIEKHIKTARDKGEAPKSPMEGTPLEDDRLMPNKRLKSRVQRFLDKYPSLRHSDELAFPEKLQQAAIDAVKAGDIKALAALIEKDIRVLTRPLVGIQSVEKPSDAKPAVVEVEESESTDRVSAKMAALDAEKKDALDKKASEPKTIWVRVLEAKSLSLFKQLLNSYARAKRLNQLPKDDKGIAYYADVTGVTHALGTDGLKDYGQALGCTASDYNTLAFAAIEESDALRLQAILPLLPDLDVLNDEGETLLHEAVRGACVRAELKKLPAETIKAMDVKTLQSTYGMRFIIALLEAGCDGKAKNKAEKRPYEIAKSNGHRRFAAEIEKERRRVKLKPFIDPLKAENTKLRKSHALMRRNISKLFGTLLTFSALSKTFGGDGSAERLALLPDGRLVSGGGGTSMKVWDVNKGICEVTLDIMNTVMALVVLPDGRVVSASSGFEGNCIKVWNVKKRVCEVTFRVDRTVLELVVLPDGRVVSSDLESSLIKVWNVNKRICEVTLEGHAGGVTALSVLPDGRVVSGGSKGDIKVWNVKKGVCEVTQKVHSDAVSTLVSLESHLMMCGGRDIKLWDLNKGKSLLTLKGHTGAVNALAIFEYRSGSFSIVSGSDDKSIKVWSSTSEKKMVCKLTLKGHKSAVTALVALPDGRVVSASRHDKTIKVWRINDLKGVLKLEAEVKALEKVLAPEKVDTREEIAEPGSAVKLDM